MSEDVRPDSTDTGTLRPKAKPIREPGTHFEPMHIPERRAEITLPPHASPNDPITLFTLYYPPKIIDTIVRHTNLYVRVPKDLTKPRARATEWYPTTSGEIYIYLALRIYMTLHIEQRISDYWKKKGELTPIHPITKYLARDRFLELHMRFRVHAPGVQGVYNKVSSFIYLTILLHFSDLSLS